MSISSPRMLGDIKTAYEQKQAAFERQVMVCGGAGCVSCHCQEVKDALEAAVEELGLGQRVRVMVTGCIGICAVGPVMVVQPEGVLYTNLDPERAAVIARRHLLEGEIVEEYAFYDHEQKRRLPYLKDIGFFREQVRIALRNCGQMEYASLEAYIARDGYAAIAKALAGSPADVVEEIKRSGLRGRGGAGFPTGVKWEAGMKAPGEQKYMVCNADEGDPGAFMDRSILEGDPHSLIEGMMLGGYAIGANRGYVYVRAEYPLAVERLSNAIHQARDAGLLGKGILGSAFDFDLEIRIGAGAFVCGEETALLNSVEGRRGEPNQKPPFPFESGLFHCPTIINNVETLANAPAILFHGAEWFRGFGTEKSPGTKVFALSGKINNTGLVEVPMGIPLGEILYTIGGGIPGGKGFKAIQSGGPSGGCLTRAHLNTPVDYESLAKLGAIMGSGGLIVMDEDTCMVDTARYFMDFIRDESCGKCLPCRVGTKRMLEILERITQGEGKPEDLDMLEELAETLQQTAMCGLGQTAPNPILSTLQYFRDEYETHIYDRHCDAGVCSNLYISPCRNACPASVDVPGYMNLVAAGRLMDAYRLIRQENPFPAVCGRICTHPCERHCRRSQVDEPLAICSIKRFVGDFALSDAFEIPAETPLKPTGKRVAVIGAGPSGLTCAYYLNQLGHGVDVYEAEQVPGGVLYWGIPEYRLPNSVLLKEIQAIEKAGVKIHLGVTIGKDRSLDDLCENYDAVYIASGTQKARKLGLAGENLPQVESGLSFLRRIGLGQNRAVPRRLAIVGGGSTAFDCARTAKRLGAEEVTIVYRRTEAEMPAGAEEVVEASEEGIRLETLASPLEILSENGEVVGLRLQRMQPGNFGKDGRRWVYPVQDGAFALPCDGIVAAIDQEMDDYFINAVEERVAMYLDVDRFTVKTRREGVFAGGDANPHRANVVIEAIADGKRAAVNIDRYLGGKGELHKGAPIDIPTIPDEVVEEHPRFPIQTLSPEKRCDNFDEVVCGYHRLDAMAESLRCLHCDRR
ncbi:MAG TPA: NADH-quinone oxidoreductase subunit NuoF [Candidatus Limiplasma stercoravium]|nr:NADH-quinone oxidoreductase subunit NuoF [Candidatus Limiplasma stercoravium]